MITFRTTNEILVANIRFNLKSIDIKAKLHAINFFKIFKVEIISLGLVKNKNIPFFTGISI